MTLNEMAKKTNKKYGRYVMGKMSTHLGRKEILMTAQKHLTNAEMIKLIEFIDQMLIEREEF